MDILPTFTAIAGGKLGERKIDGHDIRSLLLGDDDAKSPYEAFYYYWNLGLDGIRSGPWKLHFPHTFPSLTGEPGRDGKPGGITQGKIELSLFNLADDPAEQKNVIDDHPDVVARLQKLADAARADLGDEHRKLTGNGRRAAGQSQKQ
jgi:arylsulfatase A